MPEIFNGRALAVVLLGLLASAFAVDQDAKGRVTINNTCRVYHPAALKSCPHRF